MFRMPEMHAVAVCLLISLFVSCAEEPTRVGQESDAITKASDAARNHFAGNDLVIIDDIGGLHNEILTAFEAIHPLESEEPRISRNEFVQVFVQAANNAMVAQGYLTAYAENDVTVLLNCYDAYTQEGVYDFYGQGESDPYTLLEYLHAKGELTDDEHHNYVAAFDELYREGPAASSATEPSSSQGDRMARQVLSASREFWHSRGVLNDSYSGRNPQPGPQLAIDCYSLGIIAADAVGAIIARRLVGPGHDELLAAAAALASAAFVALAGAEEEGGGSGGGGGGAG